MVGIHFALAVVYPSAGNLGGGGFLMYRENTTGEITSLDFREMVPGAAHKNMYLDEEGTVIDGKNWSKSIGGTRYGENRLQGITGRIKRKVWHLSVAVGLH